MARKVLTPTVRFEVFKRDKFTFVYCGKSAPDVTLEVDHIKPVSKGGTNDIMNLVTSCRECNRGKRDKLLSDDSAVKKQKKQLDDMQDRREQLEMMLKWRESLAETENLEIDAIEKIFNRVTNKWGLNEDGRRDIRKLIKRFGLVEVYNACEIALNQYFDGSLESCINAFDKIGGICYNRQKAREANA